MSEIFICLLHVRGRLRSVSPSPIVTTGLHSIGYKYKLINFNQCSLRVYTYCFASPFRKAKFCGVPSRANVKVGCAVGKRKLRNTALNYSLVPKGNQCLCLMGY
jgi:hypothetical protein